MTNFMVISKYHGPFALSRFFSGYLLIDLEKNLKESGTTSGQNKQPHPKAGPDFLVFPFRVFRVFRGSQPLGVAVAFPKQGQNLL